LGDSLHALAEQMHDRRVPDKRWRGGRPIGTDHATPSSGLQDQASKLCGSGEKFEILFVQLPTAVEGRLEDGLDLRVGRWDPEYDRLGGPGRCDEARLVARWHFPQANAAHREDLLHLPLEDSRQAALGDRVRQSGAQSSHHRPQVGVSPATAWHGAVL
jgi:hypothetical protein